MQSIAPLKKLNLDHRKSARKIINCEKLLHSDQMTTLASTADVSEQSNQVKREESLQRFKKGKHVRHISETTELARCEIENIDNLEQDENDSLIQELNNLLSPKQVEVPTKSKNILHSIRSDQRQPLNFQFIKQIQPNLLQPAFMTQLSAFQKIKFSSSKKFQSPRQIYGQGKQSTGKKNFLKLNQNNIHIRTSLQGPLL